MKISVRREISVTSTCLSTVMKTIKANVSVLYLLVQGSFFFSAINVSVSLPEGFIIFLFIQKYLPYLLNCLKKAHNFVCNFS